MNNSIHFLCSHDKNRKRTALSFQPTLSSLLLCLVLAGCATPSTEQEEPSRWVVHTSTSGSGTKSEPTGGAASRPVTPPRASWPETAPSTGSRRASPSAPVAERRSHGPTTMLNFVDADLQGVVRALAAFTGRNFVVDPRVRGPLTLVSEMPVDASTAYSMLLAALRMQGYAVVEVDGIHRVVPEADAKLQGMAVAGGSQGSDIAGGELVTRVFPLRYENAVNLVPILRPMIAPNNTINAYPGNNTLVITDYADNLDRIARVIDEVDTPDAFSTDVVPIRYGVALDVAALAGQLLNGNSRNDPGGQVVVVADPRSNSVLLRAGTPEKLKLARDLIRRIDRPETGTGNLNVVYLRNAQATHLAEVLRGVLSASANTGSGVLGDDLTGNSLRTSGFDESTGTSSSQGNRSFETPATSAMGGFGQPLGGNRNTQTTAFSAGGASIQADPTTNTLIIAAPPPLYRSLREIIDQLDQRRAQVLVESLIVEVSADDAAEFGIQWMAGGSDIASGRSSFFGGANYGGSGISLRGATGLDGLPAGMSLGVVKGTVNILGNELLNLSVLARAMESRGKANVLSTPNLMTLDNEEASIMVGQTLPVVTGRYTTAADGASNPFQTISREDVGLTLRIRPQISEGNTVKMRLYQEVSSIDEVATDQHGGLVTRKRALETDVLVDDGQIIVLGGLLEENISQSRSSVPVLGDVPVLGNLFRYDKRNRNKTNLMVFLRPHIVRTAQDSAGITLDRYNYMRAAQAAMPPLNSWISNNVNPATLPAFEQNPETGLLDLRGAPQDP